MNHRRSAKVFPNRTIAVYLIAGVLSADVGQSRSLHKNEWGSTIAMESHLRCSTDRDLDRHFDLFLFSGSLWRKHIQRGRSLVHPRSEVGSEDSVLTRVTFIRVVLGYSSSARISGCSILVVQSTPDDELRTGKVRVQPLDDENVLF